MNYYMQTWCPCHSKDLQALSSTSPSTGNTLAIEMKFLNMAIKFISDDHL